MAFSSIAVYFDAEPASLEGLRYAAELIAKPKGRLIGIFVSLPVNVYHDWDSSSSFSRGVATLTVAQQMNDDSMRAHEKLKALLAKTARSVGVDYEFRLLPFEADLHEASQHGRYADLSILRSPDFLHAERNPYGWSTADLVLASGTPCILVPTHRVAQSSLQKVAIAWSASRESRRAVSDSIELLKNASEVIVIIVDPHSHVGAHGEEPGADIAIHLANHGVRAHVHVIDGRNQEPGRALIDQATQQGAQIIVMGAYGHSRLASIVLGSTTSYAIEHSPIPLFMSH